MNKFFLTALCALTFSSQAFCAHLGFKGPYGTVKPGEIFTVNLTVSFDSSDINLAYPSPCVKVNVVWPEGIQIYSQPQWNISQFNFSDTFFDQNDDGTFLWATANPILSAISPYAEVTIATLHCIATDEVLDESFYYETFEDDSYPTSIVDYNGIDILGSPDDVDDGIDELSVSVDDLPGYRLALVPHSPSVPFTTDDIPVNLFISRASDLPADYDHIRTFIEYDSTVLHLNPLSLTNTLPPFFSFVSGGLVVTNIISNTGTNSFELGAFLDLSCQPTNYQGLLATLLFSSLTTEEDIDIDLLVNDQKTNSVVQRMNADLLGFIYDENDGVDNCNFSIRFVDGLALRLTPESSVLPVSFPARAKLEMVKECSGDVIYNEFGFEVMFNTNLISYSDITFSPNTNVINDANALISIDLTTNIYFYTPTTTNTLHYGAVNASMYVNISFLHTQLLASNQFDLGFFTYTPRRPGTIGFLNSYASIELDLSELLDENSQSVGWPVLLDAMDEKDITSQLRVFLGPSPIVSPGEIFTLSTFAVGNPVSNAFCRLYWQFDPSLLEFINTADPAVSILQLPDENGSTSTVLQIAIDSFFTDSLTSRIADISFKAIVPGSTLFQPCSSDENPFFSSIEVDGKDVLGSRYVSGDGVSACSVVVKDPDEVYLSLKPVSPLSAGKTGKAGLYITNPSGTPWNEISCTIELDPEDVLVISSQWDILLPNTVTIFENSILENVPLASGITNKYGTEITNFTSYATLKLSVDPPVSNISLVAAFPLIPLREDPVYYIETSLDDDEIPVTRVSYNGCQLLCEDNISDQEWPVAPCGMYIWLDSPDFPPVLGSNYFLTATIHNPLQLDVTRATLCWSFDSTLMKVISCVGLHNFISSNIWINNFNDGEGYVCADITLPSTRNDTEIPLFRIGISPRVSDIIEIYPDEDIIETLDEFSMSVRGPHPFNYLELMDEWPTDLCPTWRRGVVWLDIPQLVFDELELDMNEIYQLDLTWEGEGLANFKSNTVYRWWATGNNHIAISFSSLNNTARIIPALNWSGEEFITIYCQEVGASFIGSGSLRVVIGDSLEPSLNIALNRDEFLTIADHEFNDLSFSIQNATSGTVVSATIIVNKITNDADIVNLDTDDRGTSIYIANRGKLIWHTPVKPGYYLGQISAATYEYGRKVDSAIEYFYVEVAKPYIDNDGDAFYILYNHSPLRAIDRTVTVTKGNDSDSLIMKVIRSKDGDGLVALDSIISDHGFKKISLCGSINYIETDGPIGSLTVKGGVVGEVRVKRGDLNSMRVNSVWDNYWQEFSEVGIVNGVSVAGSIGKIIVSGGNIGDEDQPALIESINGSIKTVMTKLTKRVYMDSGDPWIELGGYCGANVYASIRALKGSIGKIIASGGSIGTIPDYSHTVIESKFGIKQITAKAVEGDYEILGGFIHSDINTEGIITKIAALGGDINGSEDAEPADASELAEYPVSINAAEIKSMRALAKAFFYGDPDPDFWEWELRGGNIGIYAEISGNIGSILTRGGNLCGYVHARGDISSITTKMVKFREDRDSIKEYVGGNIIQSVFLPNVEYMSSISSEYKGTLKKLHCTGDITESWIGVKGPVSPSQFKYRRLNQSEIWINGRRTM